MKYDYAIRLLTAVAEVCKITGRDDARLSCERGIALMKLHEAFPEIEGTPNATDTAQTSH